MVATIMQYEELFGHIENAVQAVERCACTPMGNCILWGSLLNFTVGLCSGWDNI